MVNSRTDAGNTQDEPVTESKKVFKKTQNTLIGVCQRDTEATSKSSQSPKPEQFGQKNKLSSTGL